MKLEVVLGLVGVASFAAGWLFGEVVRFAWGKVKP